MGDKMLSYECFLDLAVILIAAKLFGILFRKLHLPQVVGVLVAGLIIGPNVLGIVSESDFLVTMAELGVIMLMFTAGLETDLKELMHTGPAALCIASFGVLVPLIGGYLLHATIYGFAPIGSEAFFQSLFIGVIITATSVSITVETLREMGKLKGKVGTTILSAAIIDDVIGIVILTFVIGLKKPNSAPFTVIFNTISFLLSLVFLVSLLMHSLEDLMLNMAKSAEFLFMALHFAYSSLILQRNISVLQILQAPMWLVLYFVIFVHLNISFKKLIRIPT